MTDPVLVCCSHGTDSAAGRAVVTAIVDRARASLGVETRETYVDVQQPQVDEVVASVEGPTVVVPLLLSPGFHTAVDIGRAAASRDDVVVTPTLGPHPFLVEALEERLERAGVRSGDHVVLAASGSSRPEAAARVEQVRAALDERIAAPVTVGFAYGARPTVTAAVRAARASGARRVVIASYVLAPGHFADLIAAAGADVVTDPLGVAPSGGADERIVRIVAERYRTAAAELIAEV